VTAVSNADRVVFPEIGRTKGDVVAYYERVAPRALPHVAGRPLSLKRYPRGIAEPGFFQKNVPPHYPPSIARFPVPRSHAATRKHPRGAPAVTVFPLIHEPGHLAYLANQGAIELHVPTAPAAHPDRPDRVILDLDPPAGALDLVRRAARLAREALAAHGLDAALVATGSKGYHVVAPIRPALDVEPVGRALHELATLLVARHPDVFTLAFRVANRGARVFLDWMRNFPGATAVAPYSLRARPRAPVAAPISWDELDATPPDGFTLDDAARLVERPDALAALPPGDAAPFVAAVGEAFARSGLVLETFDRFRS
jgi:bifunctional non-homologous end joining protein LigD